MADIDKLKRELEDEVRNREDLATATRQALEDIYYCLQAASINTRNLQNYINQIRVLE